MLQARMTSHPCRVAAFVASLCATIALLGVSPAATQAAGAKTSARGAPLRGVDIGDIAGRRSLTSIDSEVALAKRLHASVIRVEVPWSQFEPIAPNTIDPRASAAADRLMRDAAKAHIKVLALVDSTPCWASSAPSSLLSECPQTEGSHAHAWPPRSASDFGSFVGWFAKRYGSRLAAIEVWNEPDQANQDYLAGPEKPQHYAALLKAAYPAIKHADPAVKVLAGSLVGSNGAFMDALYKQGIKGYYDAVAVHFYTLVLGSVRRFREVQLENGDHKPLWLDEFGWSSCWPKHKIEQEQGCVTKQVQAQNITSSFRELAHTPYLAAMLTYGLRDVPGEEFGVLATNGRHKPSFHALSSVLASPFGRPSPVSLKLRDNHGRVIASGSGPVGDYMKLEVFRGGRLRYKAIFTLNRFNRYALTLPRALGTKGLTVRVYQYWLGPSHDAQRSI